GARAGNASTGGQNAMQVGLGMTVAAIDRDMNQGALQSTGRTLDMASSIETRVDGPLSSKGSL
ncbi:MAG: hypothetical protein RQ753_08920, partial [Desulfurivibrionaceae bacterium]|nr:hypothetical protein [Desulfurivibrionaceae bacterium]